MKRPEKDQKTVNKTIKLLIKTLKSLDLQGVLKV